MEFQKVRLKILSEELKTKQYFFVMCFCALLDYHVVSLAICQCQMLLKSFGKAAY